MFNTGRHVIGGGGGSELIIERCQPCLLVVQELLLQLLQLLFSRLQVCSLFVELALPVLYPALQRFVAEGECLLLVIE